MKDILTMMICNAWYPVNYFKLNFGFSDKLSQNILLIREELRIPLDINLNELYNILKNTDNKNVQKSILHFNQQVPHRFLYPWVSGSKKEVKAKSQIFFNNCLYRLNDDEDQTVEINPEWKDYILRNLKILLDFAYWNLLDYLQARNPNVPAIGSKLIKPITRNSLYKQKRFWDTVIQELGTFHCIYTGKLLKPSNYDIDHFIPWSFVTHDQIWNLIPADSSINPIKSNKIPPLTKYLDPFAKLQHEALKIMYYKTTEMKLLEDYLILGPDIKNIVTAPIEEFKHKYHDILSPLVQIAVNSGFEIWEK